MRDELKEILDRAKSAVADAPDLKELRDVEVQFLGKKGSVSGLLRNLGSLPPDERKKLGQEANELRQAVTCEIADKRQALEEAELRKQLEDPGFDVTRPGVAPPRGSQHPLTHVFRRLESIFLSMGFEVLDGPEVETDYFNFQALNIPEHHPARDMQDTFYLESGQVLRTHTSPVQIRAMQSRRPPLRVVALGRVFRYEAIDASHENTFHQIEGLMIDRDISVANLTGVLKYMLQEVFEREVRVRLRPGYFPFVEPGFELEFGCVFCDGDGCKVCKQAGWIELLGCGLVHPNVLRESGVDPEEFTGFAFGMGIERLAMMKYGINDIRHFMSGDLRFLRQF
ncbi:MAG: phenylalanine--tRNA ligase subunit alpha [Planctomycetota bacterium]